MFRLLKFAGPWHRPAHLDPNAWQSFAFDKSWANLNKMFNLRQYYIEIAPPFSKYAAPRVSQMEQLDDDIAYFHAKRSIYRFIAWMGFVLFIVDWDLFEATPFRSWRQDAQPMHDMGKVRHTHMRDDK